MSQLFSQPIPIAKFSHNTCPVGTRHFTWTHTLRSDLDFTLQEVRVVDELGRRRAGVVLTIAAGAEVFVCSTMFDIVTKLLTV